MDDAAVAVSPDPPHRAWFARFSLRRIPLWVRIPVFAVLGIYVAYLVVANVLLRGRYISKWVTEDDPNGLEMTYGSTWTVLPGRVHLHDFCLKMQDSDVQFRLDIESAVVDVKLWELTKRRFHASRVRASGVSYFLRSKPDDPRGQEARIAAYPPVVGFANVVAPAPPSAPTVRNGQYDKWTVQLDDVAASIRELWALEYHYKGDGGVAGAFHLQPMKELWLTPTVLTCDGGVLMIGNKPIVSPAHIRLEAKMDPFDVGGPTGLEMFRQIAAQVHVDGDFLSIEPFGEVYVDPPTRFEKGAGTITVDIELDRGLLVAPKTHAVWLTKDVRLITAIGAFEGDLDFEAKVDGVGPDGFLAAAAKGASGSFSPAKDAAATLSTIALGVTFDHADVTRDFTMTSLTGSVGAARVADVTKLNSLLPADVALTSGSASMSGRFSYRDHALDARCDLALEKAHLKTPNLTMNASGKAWCAAKAKDVRESISFPELGADLGTVGVHVEGSGIDDLWVKIRAANAIEQKGRESTTLDVTAGPGDRVLRFFAGVAGVPKEAADLASGSQADATMHLAHDKGGFRMTIDHAQDGNLKAKGHLKMPAESKLRGAFLVELGPLSVGVLLQNGKTSARPLAGDGFLLQN